jgi:hypothetical protein
MLPVSRPTHLTNCAINKSPDRVQGSTIIVDSLGIYCKVLRGQNAGVIEIEKMRPPVINVAAEIVDNFGYGGLQAVIFCDELIDVARRSKPCTQQCQSFNPAEDMAPACLYFAGYIEGICKTDEFTCCHPNTTVSQRPEEQ